MCECFFISVSDFGFRHFDSPAYDHTQGPWPWLPGRWPWPWRRGQFTSRPCCVLRRNLYGPSHPHRGTPRVRARLSSDVLVKPHTAIDQREREREREREGTTNHGGTEGKTKCDHSRRPRPPYPASNIKSRAAAPLKRNVIVHLWHVRGGLVCGAGEFVEPRWQLARRWRLLLHRWRRRRRRRRQRWRRWRRDPIISWDRRAFDDVHRRERLLHRAVDFREGCAELPPLIQRQGDALLGGQ